MIPIQLTAAASLADLENQKIYICLGRPLDLAQQITTLVILNEKIEDIMEILASLNNAGLLIICHSENERQGLISWYVIRNLGC